MGREAICSAEWEGGAGEVRALLEGDALIVRGGARRTLTRAGLAAAVAGDVLIVGAGSDRIALHLGAATARQWAAKIAAPPPSLAAKLGIGPATRVAAIAVTDPDLVAAVGTGIAATADADLTVAEVADAVALDAAVAAAGPALWLAHGKGRAAFGEAAVRDAMRARGWIDVKVARVSDRLTATKFARRA